MIFRKETRFALLATAAMSALAAPVAVEAQEITSAIRGTVTSETGAGINGLRVVVTHGPTGSRSVSSTNASGAFLARGLRPGGPYTIEIEGNASVRGQRFEDVFLSVNDTLPLDVTLSATGGSVEEIEVVGTRFAPISTGAGASSYGSDKIDTLPTIGRDFKDTIRLNPFVDLNGENTAISIAGANNRFNNITLDGISQSDTFGLNANGLPTQRTPISIDAIEQVGVAVAPFDVEFGRFTGGQVNVVTKSGTNEFHGSAFYQYRDDSLAGDTSKEDDIDLGTFEQEFYGASLGGPIIKDKLFFFVNYEKFEASVPNDFIVSGDTIGGGIRDITVADLNRVSQIANDVYGIDTLGFDLSNIDESDEKIFAKIDWNINDDHRAFFSYQRTDGNSLQPQNTGGGNFAFLSNYYNRSETLDAFNFQLFSDWSDRLSTEVKVGYSERTTGQVSLSDPSVGEVRVRTADGGTIFFGTDDARHANQLENELLQIKLKADYLAGDHHLTAGVELERTDVFNLFIFNALGTTRFDSIDDFENGIASQYDYANAISNNPIDGAAEFTQDIFTYYVQDEWTVSDKVTLTGGIRIDYYSNDDLPAFNNNFFARNGFTNTARLNDKTLVQPRFGFTYDINERTKLSGGAGLFGGGDPTVWVSNGFSLDGVTVSSFNANRSAGRNVDVLNGLDLRSIPVEAQNGLIAGNGDVAAVDPDFDVPSVWRYNLKLDRYQDLGFLGDDWHFAVEAIITKTKDAAIWRDLRRTVVGRAIDGSPIYSDEGGFDLLLTNTDEGSVENYAFSFDKSWDFGLSIFGSYTYTDAESVVDGTSSTAQSNFNFPASTDRNNPVNGTSPFEIRHQIKLGATYQHDFWDDNTTTISLFYNGRSGRPFSLTFNEFLQFGGTGSIDFGDNHLVFIPRADQVGIVGTASAAGAAVLFNDQATLDAFNAFVTEFDLEEYRGTNVDKQSERSPFVNELDLRISQEISTGFGKVELWMDMENVLNFIDSDLGRIEESNNPQQALIDVDVLDDGRFLYTQVNDTSFTLRQQQSVWRLQFGVRYKF